MKIAIIFSLLAIAYLTVWNWRRFSNGVRSLQAVTRKEQQTNERMAEFGKHRERMLRARQKFAELTGLDSAQDPRWDFVNTSYKQSVAALTGDSIKVDQATYHMQYGANHAERIVEQLQRETSASAAT